MEAYFMDKTLVILSLDCRGSEPDRTKPRRRNSRFQRYDMYKYYDKFLELS